MDLKIERADDFEVTSKRDKGGTNGKKKNKTVKRKEEVEKKTHKRPSPETDNHDSEDDDFMPSIKKVKTTQTSGSTPSSTPSSSTKSRAHSKNTKKPQEDPPVVRKWWNEEDWRVEDKKDWKWRTLVHNGVCFPGPYEPHGIKMKYDGQEIELTPEQEEIATFYAIYLDTDHVKKPQFSKNYFQSFKKYLGKDHVIQNFDLCDFGPVREYVMDLKQQKKNASKEEKQRKKEEQEKIKDKYGYAMIDGFQERISNYMVEPPGLFLGRGDHPKTGMLKLRIKPEDVTLNLSEDAPIPPAPPGHKWGGIIHDHKVSWIATWRENVLSSPKYVYFGAQSSLKGKSDREKFETAKRLKLIVHKIRNQYMADLKDKTILIRQRATTMWIIDHLALRVGNEKDPSEADTVGCCSLRKEHLKLIDPQTVEFDFLGKDSMRYHNSVEVHPLVYKNLKMFLNGKSNETEVFDQLNPHHLNQHLQSLMPKLTAKVFRTYNASETMQTQLAKWDPTNNEVMSVEEKVLFFNRASMQVAMLCNHQRTLPKTFAAQMDRIDDQISEAKKEIHELEEHLQILEEGKAPKIRKSENDEVLKPFSNNPDVVGRNYSLK